MDSDEKLLNDGLPVCPRAASANEPAVVYGLHGRKNATYESQDESAFISDPKRNLSVYILIEGHDGARKLASIAVQRLVFDLYLDSSSVPGGLCETTPDDEVKRVIVEAFKSVDETFFSSIAEQLAKRAELRDRIEGMSLGEANTTRPNVVAELEAIEPVISGGAMAVVAVIVGNRLFVANIGTARALLCRADLASGQHTVTQLSVLHDVDNKDESLRLIQLGLSVDALKNSEAFKRRTRSFGNYRFKDGYKENAELAAAVKEPHTCIPDIQGPIRIDESCRFLVLMASGVYSNWETATTCAGGNAAIAGYVAVEFAQQTSYRLVCSAVLDRIGRLHQEAFQIFKDDQKNQSAQSHLQHREPMTILVRAFNQELLPAPTNITLAHTQMAPYAPLPPPDSDATLKNQGTFTYGESCGASQESSDDMSTRKSVPWAINADGRLKPYVDFTKRRIRTE